MAKPQEVPTYVLLEQAMARADQSQKIMRYILVNKELTRLEIATFVMDCCDEETKLAQQLLNLYREQTKEGK